MQVRELVKGQSFVLMALLLFATFTSVRAQKARQMILGPSFKELVPESSNSDQDGVSQIIFAQLFKPGPTEYTHVGSSILKDAPPLPTGYTLFQDQVYEVKTKAIITSAFNITVFNVPSVETESVFKKLAVLHLEADEMSPSGKSWNEVTLFSEKANERSLHFISKDAYESLQPDSKTKRIAGVTNDFGIFVLALAPESKIQSRDPFTDIEISATNSPEPVLVGDKVTHTILVRNNGFKTAAEVNVNEELNPECDYLSVTSNQGTCKASSQSSGRVLCYLGVMPIGAVVSIKIVGRVHRSLLWAPNETSISTANILEVIFKRIRLTSL